MYKGKVKAIEELYGAPLRVVLRELYLKHGSQIGVASELGISQSTLSGWILKCNLRHHTVLVDSAQDEYFLTFLGSYTDVWDGLE